MGALNLSKVDSRLTVEERLDALHAKYGQKGFQAIEDATLRKFGWRLHQTLVDYLEEEEHESGWYRKALVDITEAMEICLRSQGLEPWEDDITQG